MTPLIAALGYIDPNLPGLPPPAMWGPMIASLIAAITGWASVFAIGYRVRSFVKAHKIVNAAIVLVLMLATVAGVMLAIWG